MSLINRIPNPAESLSVPSNPKSPDAGSSRKAAAVCLAPLAVLIALCSAVALQRTVSAQTDNEMIAKQSSNEAREMAIQFVIEATGQPCTVVDVVPEITQSRRTVHTTHYWAVRCRTCKGIYAVHLDADKQHVARVNLIDEDELGMGVAAPEDQTRGVADIENAMSRDQAKQRALAYLRCAGVPLRGLHVRKRPDEAAASHIGPMHPDWDFTFIDDRLPNRVVDVSIHGVDGRLNFLWATRGV
jgi:hypothetical protein